MPNSAGTLYGQAVGRQKKLWFLGNHIPQGGCPFPGVTLGFLGITRIRKRPNKEVTGTDSAMLGYPCPGVVIGFSPGMVQMKVHTTDH